jgi:hypothetical protein
LGSKSKGKCSNVESDDLINATYSILVHEIEYHPTWAILDIGFKHLVLVPKIEFDKHEHQCSRLKPSYEFHFEGLSNFKSSVEGLVQIQDVNPRI